MNFVTVLFFLGLLLTIVASVGLLRLTGKKAPQEQRLWPLAQKLAADEMAETEKDTENAEDAAPEQAALHPPAHSGWWVIFFPHKKDLGLFLIYRDI